nr:glycosyltransferase [Cellulomonas hominis]
MCAALDPVRVRTTVVLFADGPLVAALQASGATVHVLPLARTLAGRDRATAGRSALGAARDAAATVPFVLRLAAMLRRLRPDVVHSTSLKADLLAVPAATLARCPLVWHVHDRIADDYLPPVLVRLVRALARRGPRHVVVNSMATARTLLPLPRGWTLAYPGLAPEQILPDPAARRAPAVPTVGLLGRVSPTKGQLEFVEAAALLAPRYPHLRFRVVGAALFAEADYARRVADRVAELGLGDRVELAGWSADPVAAIDALSVLVHASPVPEPFGQVVAEGMARGVPVVATAGGGVGEIVAGVDGRLRALLVPPRDVPALAAAVARVLDEPDEARERAHRAWAEVRARFTAEQTAEAVTCVWERLRPTAHG